MAVPEVGLYAEVRKQIGVVQVVVLVGDRTPTKVHSEIHRNSIEVDFPDKDSKYTFTLPDGVGLNPKSCQGLHWVSGDGIHMRLQLAGDCKHDADEGIDDGGSGCSSVDVEIKALRQSDGAMFRCVSCSGSLLASPRSFSRVLPLPSENWREMSSDWCCHGNEYTRSLGQSSLAPNEADCFVSELYLSVHPVIMDANSVIMKAVTAKDKDAGTSTKRSQVQCCRCRQVLGEALYKANPSDDAKQWSAIENVHLYKHCIQVSDVRQEGGGLDGISCNIFSNYSLEMFLANHFASLSKSQMSFKFIVQSTDDNKAVLLLWLLSYDTMLLCSRSSAVSSCWKPFHGDEEDERDDRDDNDGVQYFRIAKILYHHRKDESFTSLLQEWNRDFGVETVRLPTHSCMELLLLLTTSTQNTPVSLRTMEGFKVGYLRMTTDANQT
ncbi:E3 ubiquitin-protein ligase E3D-like [Amphiura filiformis]|uniref:E3 ubiquitin-protein ligase E3D-like n=1 Tax=Amphiura filiformis TaxID=82378 RepID=UPI003B21C687